MSSTTATSTDPAQILSNIPNLYRGPGGAVAIVRNGKLEAHHVWGYADLNRRIAMTSKTRLPICSISKQMLCLAILDLERTPTDLMKHAEGNVWDQMSAELPRLLPNLMETKQGLQLSIHHLHKMQSGIRDYWAETVLWGAHPEQPFSLLHDAPQTLERIQSFHFEPGMEFSYCNVNFHVLGRLVEKVSGQSLSQLLAERVFKPAGMATAELVPNCAGLPLPIVGYEGDEKKGYYPALNGIEWSGDAGVVASLEDMIAYEKYLERSFADPKSTYYTMAQQQKYKDGTPAAYGYGLGRGEIAGKIAYAHGGGLRGFSLQRAHMPDEHLSVVVLFNHEGPSGAATEHIFKKALNFKEPDEEGKVKPAPEWKGNFLDEETQLLIKSDINDKGELLIEIFGQMKMTTLKDANHAERLNMTASIDGDTITVNPKKDNRTYKGRRITKPISSTSTATENLTKSHSTDYAGSYSSTDIKSTFHCTPASEDLMYGAFEGFLGTGPAHLMRYVGEDIWLLACPRAMDSTPPGDWTCVFKRGEGGKIVGVTVGCWLARKVEYTKA